MAAYPGFQRGGCLRLGPIRKVGRGGGAVAYDGGGAVRLRRGGGGGGGGGGGCPSPLSPPLDTPLTYVLPRYTSHARANERKIHAGKG